MAGNVGGSGPVFFTDITLSNNTDDYLSLYDQIDEYGSGNRPQVIPAKWSTKIKHNSDPSSGNSKGGVAYTISGNIRWVLFWISMNGETNEVYTDLVETDTDIDWSQYPPPPPPPPPPSKFGYAATADTEESSNAPLVQAILQQANTP